MAGKAPRGLIGGRKIVAAKKRIEKENEFLGSLRAYTLSESVAELLGGERNKEGTFTLPNVLVAIREAKELVKLPEHEKTIFFRDNKRQVVPLIRIVESQKIRLTCENQIKALSRQQK